jgi:type IV secretory pathway TrbD component
VKSVGALLVLAACGFAAAAAVADTTPLPPVPTLSSPVPLPTVTSPVPLPTVSSPLPTSTATPPPPASSTSTAKTTAVAATSPSPSPATTSTRSSSAPPSAPSSVGTPAKGGGQTASLSDPSRSAPTRSSHPTTRSRTTTHVTSIVPAPTNRAAAPSRSVHSGVLATTAEKAVQRISRPYLLALLGLAIVLLGVAALPEVAVPDPRLGTLLVRHRLELAGVGAVVLAAVAVALLR